MSTSLANKIQFVDAIMADPSLSPSAKLVAYALSLRFHNTRTGRCFPSYDSIAAAAGLKRRATAIEAVKELAAAEWIGVEKGGGRSKTNAIELCFDRVETVRETALFSEENGTDSVPFEEETVRKPAPFEAIKGTRNRRKGTENVPNSLENTPRLSDVGGESLPARAPEGRGFVDFWHAYPKHTGYAKARDAFERMVASGRATAEVLIAGAERYAAERAGQEPRYTKSPANWLEGGHWLDEPAPRATGGRQSQSRRTSYTDIAKEIIERMVR